MKKIDESASAAGRVPTDRGDHAPAAPCVTAGDGGSAAAETQPGYYVRQWPDVRGDDGRPAPAPALSTGAGLVESAPRYACATSS